MFPSNCFAGVELAFYNHITGQLSSTFVASVCLILFTGADPIERVVKVALASGSFGKLISIVHMYRTSVVTPLRHFVVVVVVVVVVDFVVVLQVQVNLVQVDLVQV